MQLRKKLTHLSLVVLVCSLAACANTNELSSPEAGVEQAAVSQGVDTESVGYSVHKQTASLAIQNQVYYFDFDNSRVHNADMASIDAQTNYLLKHPHARIRLEGHTDQRGSREYNIGLGWRRAKAVGQLMEQLGVKKNQLVMISYGEEKPAVQGTDPESLGLNRRVQLVYEVK